jgi:hypothetical protein
MSDTKTRTRAAAGFDAAFHAWTRDQAAIGEILDPDFWPDVPT